MRLCRHPKPNPLVRRNKNRIEPLRERIPINKIRILAGISADIVHDEVHGARTASNGCVQGTRPDLGVWRQLIRYLGHNQLQK